MALLASFADWDLPTTSAEGARQLEELAKAYKIAGDYLYPRDIAQARGSTKPVENPEVNYAFRVVGQSGRNVELFRDFLDGVEDRFHLVRTDIQRLFGRMQSNSALSVAPDSNSLMVELLDRLALWQRIWGVPVRSFNDSKLISTYTSTFHQLLHSSLPASFPTYLHSFLASSLAVLPVHATSSAAEPRLLQAVPVNYQRIPPPSPNLARLGILTRYATTLSRVAYEEISRIAREEADQGWNGRRLTMARQKVGDGVANWLSGMFEGNEVTQIAMRPMFSRFDYHLCKCFFDIRTDELFDIIVDYPESTPALEDLKECLFKVDQRSILVDKLKAANIKRLLHPGAETKDVITQYISTIRCLRILDPPGVLLHKIAEPIRRHLRDRSDTIKCIVAALVEGDELQDENEANSTDLIRQSNDDGVEDFSDPKWEPEPVDAAPQFRSGKAGDIISTLVSIYDSREVIIKELQVHLASRLLAVKDYDAVREIRTIELLKIRFSETAMQVCDVMLKDMADSKRIDDRVQGDVKSVIHPLVISRMFWPNIPSSSLHLPPKLEAMQRDYESAFHHFKPDKRLRWLQHIGTANVKLELEDRIVEVEATPLQASIAELYEEKATWTIADLAERLGIREPGAIKNALAFWVNEGVLKDIGGKWLLLERAEEEGQPLAFVQDEPAVTPFDPNGGDDLGEHWRFIRGQLTFVALGAGGTELAGLISSFGPKTTPEIHQSLRSFSAGYGGSQSDLKTFLSSVRDEGSLVLKADGKWHLAVSA